jgi:hypothetical protein
VEAHVGVQEGALLAVVKGIQVLAGKAPAPPQVMTKTEGKLWCIDVNGSLSSGSL